MITKVKSASYLGIEPFLVEVEVDISRGLPAFNIVGLGDASIIESKERIRAGIRNSGYKLNFNKITINLTPAGVRKIGTHFDLPIAIGILCCGNVITYKKEILNDYIFMGELSLSGEVKRTKGILNGAILAKELGYKGIVIPYSNRKEGRLIKDIDVVVIKNLKDVEKFLLKGKVEEYPEPLISLDEKEKIISEPSIDFSDVKGQEKAKRALEICAAGGHNLLMIGTPGCGKTMLAKRIMTILPDLTEEEKIEVTKLYSIAGKLDEEHPIIEKRPFRAPHHTSTGISIIGGGRVPALGEISLANRGVLFLDEIVEFKKNILENLREPLEERKISVTRAGYRVEFPSSFIMISSCNPCKCGYLFENDGRCTCTASEISRYSKRLSGPILDRIDLRIEMRRLTEDELMNDSERESSKEIKKRVILARDIQKNRFKSSKLNSEMTRKEIDKYCSLDNETSLILKNAIKVLGLSARSYDRILKVSRTIADLAENKNIEKEDILEALSYRINEE